MIRSAIAAVLGYAVWSALWVGLYGVLFPGASETVTAGGAVTDAGVLAGSLAFSVACSLAAGVVGALTDRVRPGRAALIAGVLLLVTGVAVQIGAWQHLPVWYHLTFLVLLVPTTLVGARCVPRRRA